MNIHEHTFDPKKMNAYLAAGAQERSETFAQAYRSVKAWFLGKASFGKTGDLPGTVLKGT